MVLPCRSHAHFYVEGKVVLPCRRQAHFYTGSQNTIWGLTPEREPKNTPLRLWGAGGVVWGNLGGLWGGFGKLWGSSSPLSLRDRGNLDLTGFALSCLKCPGRVTKAGSDELETVKEA